MADDLPTWGRSAPGADLADPVDGAWRVVEVGDGQVSDRPPALDPEILIGALTSERVQPSGRFPTAGGGRAGED